MSASTRYDRITADLRCLIDDVDAGAKRRATLADKLAAYRTKRTLAKLARTLRLEVFNIEDAIAKGGAR